MNESLLQYLAQQSASQPVEVTESTVSQGGSPSTAKLWDTLGFPTMLLMIFVFMYFFVIRPQKKEEKRKKELISSLKKGDSVVTTSGIIATVATVKDETVILKVGDGARIEFLRSAIQTIRGNEEGAEKK